MMTGEIGKWSFVALLTLAAAASTTIFMVEKLVYFFVKLFPFDSFLSEDINGDKVDFRGAFIDEFLPVTKYYEENKSGYTALPTTVVTPAPAPAPAPTRG